MSSPTETLSMSNVVHVALLVVLSTSAAMANAGTRVFVMAGQSNMAGRAYTRNLPEELRTPPANLRMVDRDGRVVPFRSRNSCGPEVSFGHAMAKQWPDDTIVIVKFAVGGTSTLAWAPEWSEAAARRTANHEQGSLYDQLLTRLRPVLKQEGVRVVGFCWAQGGRDARFPDVATDYEANLRPIFAAIRKEVGDPRLPIVLAETVDAPKERFPSVALVRAAQRKVAEADPRIAIVSSEGLATHDDRVHFNAAGQTELGRRFAKALLELVEKDEPETDR